MVHGTMLCPASVVLDLGRGWSCCVLTGLLAERADLGRGERWSTKLDCCSTTSSDSKSAPGEGRENVDMLLLS